MRGWHTNEFEAVGGFCTGWEEASKAAKELFLTQPTISSHISSLERELNARLFVRNTKEVSLSEDGIKLYKYAKQMLDLQREIEDYFRNG